jgi:lipoprotein-releasing system permease protein
MRFYFSKYFLHYIIFNKTRQRLLLFAIIGLILSSFSLLVLQSTMGGLQGKLIERSKKALGNYEILLPDLDGLVLVKNVQDYLDKNNIKYVNEYEIELLLKSGSRLSPVIVHGISLDSKWPLLDEVTDFQQAIIPQDIAYRLNIGTEEQITLISPAHVDSFFEDIPRQLDVVVDSTFSTDVPEVDSFHLWVKLELIQNLVRENRINKIRIYDDNLNVEELEKIVSSFPQHRLLSWEEQNKALVWSLKLETTVMVFLFTAMTLLVSLCITSGLLIFFDKIKKDLASYWIMGMDNKQIENATSYFLFILSFIAVSIGLLSGLVFLFLLDTYGANIMPDIFVDRKIPVLITTKGLSISFIVPMLISMIFSMISLSQFKRDKNYLTIIRSIG